MHSTKGLDEWASRGAAILLIQDENGAFAALDQWAASVAEWIASIAPDSGLQAEWFAIHPIMFGEQGVEMARRRVRERLQWLQRFPSEVEHRLTMKRLRGLTDRPSGSGLGGAESTTPYVSESRITELRAASNAEFSTRKLVRFCEELNICMASKCYLAASMLLRSISNHVPPVFKCANFDEVIAQTTGPSFNPQLKRLGTQAKNVAERFLHEQICPAEAVPHEPQVDFRSELDALLGQVAALLRTK